MIFDLYLQSFITNTFDTNGETLKGNKSYKDFYRIIIDCIVIININKL